MIQLHPHIRYRMALSHIKGMNLLVARTILDGLNNDISLFFTLPQKDVMQQTGLGSALFANEARTKALQMAEGELLFVTQKKITPLFFSDPEYPARLLECIDAPILLYWRGNCNLNSSHIVSIVGTRHMTAYGRSACETFVSDLGKLIPNIIIVSGLAYGVDVCAHQTALKVGIPTIGVLAHGLHTIYPAAHRNIAAKMVDQGGIITEYTSQYATNKGSFVARNRIVAGLADATVIIESAEKGGALITASIANSYDRDVFALPGRTNDPYSKGCNTLIMKNKAALFTSAQDFCISMNWTTAKQKPQQTALFIDLNEDEALLLKIVEATGETSIHQLCNETNLPTSIILSLLLELEFKELITALPGGIYRRS